MEPPPRPISAAGILHGQQRGADDTCVVAQAVALLAEAGRWLGVGIASLMAAFDPEIVVLGGGAMQAGALLAEPAAAAAVERLVGRGHREIAPIVPAALGDDAGVVGAALLAMQDAGR